jgi:hypothetical protein
VHFTLLGSPLNLAPNLNLVSLLRTDWSKIKIKKENPKSEMHAPHHSAPLAHEGRMQAWRQWRKGKRGGAGAVFDLAPEVGSVSDIPTVGL